MARNLGSIYAELRLRLDRLERDMSQANRRIATTGQRIRSLGDQFEATAARIGAVGRQLTMRLTLPIVGVGTAAIATGVSFEDSMAKVAAISGATGNEFAMLEAQARELGRTTRFTASEAASGMEFLARAGWNTREIMDAMPAMLNLAAAGAVDLGLAADMVSDSMMAFGMDASEAIRVADLYANAAASANTSVEQLGEGMAYAAPRAAAMGMEIEEAAAFMAVMADAGIKGSRAGTTFEAVLRDMSGAVEDGSLNFGAFTVEMYDSEGRMRNMLDIVDDMEYHLDGMTDAQRESALGMVFQSRSMRGLNTILQRGGEDIRDLTEDFFNSDGAAKQMATTMEDTVGGSLRQLRSAIEGAMIEFYGRVQPALRDVIDRLTEVARWIGNLDNETKDLIIRILAIAAAVGPALIVFAGMIKVVGTVIKFFGGLVAALGAIKLPALLVIGIVGGIAYALWRMWNENEEFRERVTAAWENIKTVAEDSFGSVRDWLVEVPERAAKAWEEHGPAITEAVETTWGIVETVIMGVMNVVSALVTGTMGEVTAFWEEYGERISKSATEVWNAVSSIVSTVMNAVQFIIETVWGEVSDWWEENGEEIAATTRRIWDLVKEIVVTTLEWIAFIVGWIAHAIEWIWEEHGDRIVEIVRWAWEIVGGVIMGILKIIEGLLTFVLGTLQMDWDKAWSGVIKVTEGVKEVFGSVWGGIMELAERLHEKVNAAVKGVTEGIQEWWSETALGRAASWLGGMFRRIVGDAEDMERELVGQSIIPDTVNAVRGWLIQLYEDSDKYSGMAADAVIDHFGHQFVQVNPIIAEAGKSLAALGKEAEVFGNHAEIAGRKAQMVRGTIQSLLMQDVAPDSPLIQHLLTLMEEFEKLAEVPFDVGEFLAEVDKDIELAAIQAEVFRDEIDKAQSETQILERALVRLIHEGFRPGDEELDILADKLGIAREELERLRAEAAYSFDVDESIAQMNEQLEHSRIASEIFGDAASFMQEKVATLENQIRMLIEEGYRPGDKELEKLIGRWEEARYELDEFLTEHLDLVEVMENVYEELELAEKRGDALGDRYDVLTTQARFLENQIISLIDQGIEPTNEVIVELLELLEQVEEQMEDVEEEVEEVDTRFEEFIATLNELNMAIQRVITALGFELDPRLAQIASSAIDAVSALGRIAAGDLLGGIIQLSAAVIEGGMAFLDWAFGISEAREAAGELANEISGTLQTFGRATESSLVGTTNAIDDTLKKLEEWEDAARRRADAGFLKRAWWWLTGTAPDVGDEAGRDAAIAFVERFSAIAQQLSSGVTGALNRGMAAFLRGEGDMLNALREGIRDAIINAIIEAVIQGAVIQGVLGDFLTALTDALTDEDWASAEQLIKEIGHVIPELSDTLAKLLGPLADSLAEVFGTGMAAGGVVKKPTLTWIAEKEPEMVIPLSRVDEVLGEAVPRVGLLSRFGRAPVTPGIVDVMHVNTINANSLRIEYAGLETQELLIKLEKDQDVQAVLKKLVYQALENYRGKGGK